jgi:hypothetical protein
MKKNPLRRIFFHARRPVNSRASLRESPRTLLLLMLLLLSIICFYPSAPTKAPLRTIGFPADRRFTFRPFPAAAGAIGTGVRALCA